MNGKIWTTLGVLALIAGASSAWGADTAATGKTVSEPDAAKSANVSIKAEDMKLREILDSFAKQTKEQIVVESSVSGQVSLTLNGVPLEAALKTLSKTSGKMEWRKVYLAADSDLIRQPDKLAATIRLMAGLSFPNMVVAGSSTDKVAAHFQDKKGISSVEDSAVKALGLVKIYLITNDAAVAEKTADKDKKEAVNKFVKAQKDQIDAFVKMTPEEREKAIVESLNIMDQVDPNYMAVAMDALSRADPEAVKRSMARQSEMLLGMSQEARRSMIRFNIQAQSMLSPELQAVLAEDAKAVMEEMKAGGQQ